MNYYARSKYQLLIFLRERQIIKHFFFFNRITQKVYSKFNQDTVAGSMSA